MGYSVLWKLQGRIQCLEAGLLPQLTVHFLHLQNSKVKMLVGLVSPESYEKESVLGVSPDFGWFVGNLWHPLPCRNMTLISASNFPWPSLHIRLFVSKFPSFIRVPVILEIEGKRRGGQQRVKWLDSITNSMDMSLSKLQEMGKDRGAWHATVHGFAKSQTRFSNWTTTTSIDNKLRYEWKGEE